MSFERIYVGLIANQLFFKRNIFSLLLILLSVNGFARHIPGSLIIPVTAVENKLIVKSCSFVCTDTTATASFNEIAAKNLPGCQCCQSPHQRIDGC